MQPALDRTTVYLQPELRKALKLKSVHQDRALSELINEAIRLSLSEDAIDLAAFEERSAEPLTSFENFVAELKKDGRL